ncbi:hypothetical protein AAG589_09440 [Isoptericola sp. F-RaC21]|uniref:hypothetical protein n=1 Tax=Isoptericola sp. F-RaC21 TaxID=3141452 RepID=UPI00315C165D
MEKPRVQDVISWRRPRRPRRSLREGVRSATGLLSAAVDLAVSVGSGTASTADLSTLGTEPPRVPQDPAQPVAELPCVVVGGTAGWLPATGPERPHLWATRGRTWVALDAGGQDVELDRTSLALRSLTLAPGEPGPWTLDARCAATVTGPGTELAVEGAWLAIAWLGHLAGWPDPGPPAAPDGAHDR